MAIADEVRRICLSFPEATEVEAWGHPTFRVRNKMFCGMGDDSASFKADPDERAALLAQGEPWFIPAYVGHRGWLGVRFTEGLDLDELRELLATSWRKTAPKRLAATFDG